MSVEDLKNYAKACAKDDSLRAKAKEIGVDNVQQQIAHAKQLGYHWDENDLQEFAKEMQAQGELSEDDLEKVAGGFATTVAAGFALAATAAIATSGSVAASAGKAY